MAYVFTTYVFDKVSGQFVKTSTTNHASGESYDNFLDAPVKNAYGASNKTFIDISTLENGAYSLSGYYKLDRSSEVEHTGADYLAIYVMTDTVTGKKVAKYETFKDGRAVLHTIVYNNSEAIEEHLELKTSTAYWESEDDLLEVKFIVLPSDVYAELAEKSPRNFYYLSDTNKLYVGNELLTSTADIESAVARIINLESDTAELQRVVTKLEGDDTVIGSVANKIKIAVDALEGSLDGSAIIATKSGKAVTIKGGISEDDGIVANDSSADIVLADVASTGSADDVAITDSGNLLESTNVENALAEIVGKVADAKDDTTIYLAHENGSLLYEIFQGGQDGEHKIGEINIPDDMVATSGSLYVATAQDTELNEGETYIRMVIANGNPFYIPVQDLIDVYVGTNTQTGITITVANGVISATIKTLDGSLLDAQSVPKTALSAGVQTSLGKADTAVQSILEGSQNGSITVDGTTVRVHGLGSSAYVNTDTFDSAGSAEQVRVALLGNAQTDTSASKTIEGLNIKVNNLVNTLNSGAVIASRIGNVITLRGAVGQTDGVISNTGDNLVLSDVAATGEAVDVKFKDDTNFLSARNVQSALKEMTAKLNDMYDSLTWKEL